MAKPNGKSARIAPAPTHTEIASRVSTHREAVTREFARLSRIGLFTPPLANSRDRLPHHSVEALVAALLAELLELSVNLALYAELLGCPFEEGNKLRPG